MSKLETIIDQLTRGRVEEGRWNGHTLAAHHGARCRLQLASLRRRSWASTACAALFTWFLLWLPAYEESCCLQLLPSSLFRSSAIWLIKAGICWQAQFQGQCLHLPVVVLTGRMQNAKQCFSLHEVRLCTLGNDLVLMVRVLLQKHFFCTFTLCRQQGFCSFFDCSFLLYLLVTHWCRSLLH